MIAGSGVTLVVIIGIVSLLSIAVLVWRRRE
jgi:LPXTG-motif cell wall-anchored protein